jgi:sugar lactone lactonase YvrE
MQVRQVVEGLDHPECVTVDRDGNLFCGGEAGQIYAISDEKSEVNQIASHGGLILGLCVNGNGTIYAPALPTDR